MKGNVRFQATPVILNHPESSLDDSTSSNNSNLDLLKALKLDEHSSPGDAPLDRTVFDDSVYNRDHFAGRTPHSKVVEAKKERRALQELMKVPVFAQNHQKEDLSLLQKDPNHNNLSKNKVEIQSNFLASTNSVRSVLNESSYHFDLMLQPVQDEDENKHPQVVSISLSKGSNGVHFDEENLVQNRLTTPSASRKIPIRKTPAPSQNFSPQEMQSTHSKVLGKELIQDGSIKKNEIPFEEVSNSSMEISSISPAHYQANFVSSMASTSSASPLASLISRPEVSKSSPIIACSPKKVVDVATSYSPPSILPAHDTFAASKKDATTSYSYSTNLVNDSQSVLISPDRVQSNPIDKRMTSDASNRQQLITESPSHYSPTWGLIKQGGVSFGRGPIFSNIAHNVASIKQGVHHVVSTVTELPVLPKVNDHPNLISSSLTTSTFSTSAELAEVNLPRPVDEADRIKPAIDWFSPRHTRKPVPLQPTQFQFPQSHHLPLNHSSTESFLEHSTSSNHVSQSTQLRQVRVDKPMIMKSEALKAAQICDVSVQVDSAMLKSNQTQEISTNISQESNLDNSYSLEELMQSATSTIMQENVTDTCSTYQQRHHLEKSARPPFDFTSCNIGGTPSTINTKFMTKTNSNSQCTSASSAYSTSLSYTTIPSLHSVDDGYKRSANIMPSSLGKPVRVPLTIEKEEYIEAVWGNEEEEFIANYNYGDHSHAEETLEDMNRDLTVNEKINQYQNLSNPDLTILTDIAIAHFTRDQQLEQDQYDDDLSIPTNSTSFFSNGMETTMTLDHSFMVKQSYPNVSESVTAPYPRLAIRSLKRDADNAFDIKELGFETSPNELMTIMLTLKNDQRNGKTIKLISKTIFLRVEPLYCQRQTENPKNSMEEYFHEDEKNSIFTVSPDVLEIPSQEEGMIFITFAPKKEGIYSGAVKITYRKKHFTLLLRGECSSQYACEKLGFAKNNQLLASAEKTSAQMVPCHAFPSSHPYQSSPETLQSIPPTHSKVDRICFTSPIDNLQSNETPDMRSSADWKEVVSPGTFQNKLRFLQKKIGEISRKITLKDTVHTKSIFHKPAMALTVPPLVQGDPKIFYNNKKKEEIFLLQSNPSSEQSTANSKFASSFNYQADTERTAIKRHISKNMENSSMSSLNGIAISSPNNKVWKGANYYSQEYQSSNSIVPAQANSVVLEEQQFAIRTEREKLTQKQVVSTSFSEHSKSRDDKAEIVVTDNNDEYLLNPTKRKGLFFRKEVERFGYTMIGSLVRTKIVLCNASNHEITVFFGDVQPPFYNHHNEVKMRAKSFVRVPVRFVPTSAGEFQQELIAQTADGKFQAVVRLVGTASSATPYKA